MICPKYLSPSGPPRPDSIDAGNPRAQTIFKIWRRYRVSPFSTLFFLGSFGQRNAKRPHNWNFVQCVRGVAKVALAVAYDPSGTPVLAKAGDIRVIRNGSSAYRTAPIKDNPEKYEVQSENPDAELSPDRCAPVLKGQAYDLSIAGMVTGERQMP